MRTWRPPANVESVIIVADNDLNGAGEIAALDLAEQLAKLNLSVAAYKPLFAGTDANDIIMGLRGKKGPELNNKLVPL